MIERAASGDRKALARVMTEIELGNDRISESLLDKLHGSFVVGITGFPGSGKSTIISGLAMELIKMGQKVGVLCVDPTSPLSGGSILGDRIRMQELSRQTGAFIRSVPTGGKKGGLGYFTVDLINALDAAGYEKIFIETVGAGQDETDIHNIADAAVTVTVPNLGDEVQAIKAGIMEIADIFVVNKADTGPADEKVKELLALGTAGRMPEVIKVVATRGEGIAGLASAIERRLQQSSMSRQERIKSRLKQLVRYHVEYRLDRYLASRDFDSMANELMSGGGIAQIISRAAGELAK
ncbi:MAG: methylmalonyl Co-A mutase-associated GTPase MeaB [Nitrososphaerota archaeon]|nr:methylmalonyl Co-A mutase-associated GTPase MeaB [Nitrososphaerota archaeon]